MFDQILSFVKCSKNVSISIWLFPLMNMIMPWKLNPTIEKNTVDYVSHDFVAFQSLHLDSWVDLNDCKSCPVADYMFDTKQALEMVNPS